MVVKNRRLLFHQAAGFTRRLPHEHPANHPFTLPMQTIKENRLQAE
jgi:hypothetical protein